MSVNKLGIITTHPIQYYAPLFQLLAYRGKIDVKVFYTWGQAQEKSHDPDFKQEVKWDIPLLEGYDFTFVENVSSNPGSRSFLGIINPSLINEIEEWGATDVLVFGWSFKSHLKALRYFKGKIPVYFRGDSNLLDEQRGLTVKKIARHAFLTWIYSYVDKCFYVGRANKDYYLKFGVQEKNLVYAPHAIDNNRFIKSTYPSDKHSQWRKERGIKNDEIVFLFAGKFISKKDPVSLLKAFLNSNHNNSVLLFVGNGHLEAQLKESAKSQSNILFEDFKNQTEMPILYSATDILVLPSVGPGETWGLAVNEAMACSKPVIVSDKVGCAIDLVHEGTNGFIFESGNVKQLSNIMRTIQNGEVNLKEMGKKSLEIIKNYNFTAICEAIETEVLSS